MENQWPILALIVGLTMFGLSLCVLSGANVAIGELFAWRRAI